MRPQFDPGQRLLASRLAYLRSEPSRGDLVVVRDPREGGAHYLKRIIGLPGEVVSVDDGMLFVDGVPLDEPYLGGLPASLGLDRADWSVGDGHYFVMGTTGPGAPIAGSLGLWHDTRSSGRCGCGTGPCDGSARSPPRDVS